MVLKGGGGRYTGFPGATPPDIEPLGGTGWPVRFPPGVLQGIAPLVLLIVLKDSEAKADILSESNTAPDTRRFMDPGLFAGQPEP